MYSQQKEQVIELPGAQQDSSSQFSLEECGEGMREALQRRRRTLVDCGHLQSSTESVIEFTAPPSSSAASFLFPAESEVIELLKMAFILQVGKLKITILHKVTW